MKKSELYKSAQRCVLCSGLTPDEKLEILRVLMKSEDIERFSEEQEGKYAGTL